MDEFEQKRGIVKMLMDMLKDSAAKEVMGGLHKPEDMPSDAHGVEIEKVSMIPGDKDAMADDDDIDGDLSPEAATLADKVMAHDHEPASLPETAMSEPHEEIEEAPMPAFSSLMKKKGKK